MHKSFPDKFFSVAIIPDPPEIAFPWIAKDGGAACGGTVKNLLPCDSPSFLALLRLGIYPLGQSNSLRAQYIEVFAINANEFPEDILQAHQELTASSSSQ